MSDIARLMQRLNDSHVAFHDMPEPTPDDPTVLVAITERDALLLGMALPSLELLFLMHAGVTCFHDASKDLQTRLVELIEAQQPDWINPDRSQ